MGTRAVSNSEIGSVPSRQEVWRMFDRIAPRYDLLNRLLSFGWDRGWREQVAWHLKEQPGQKILDLATGTADLLLALCHNSDKIASALGIDMAEKMLEIGRQKVSKHHLEGVITLMAANAMQIPLPANRFDAATMAFGIRNLDDVSGGLREMYRLLKPGGRAIILEFSLPQNKIMRILYLLYLRHILPPIGALISGDGVAYRYLNHTVETFPYGRAFCELMAGAGFRQVKATPLTGGIATIYQGDKEVSV